MKSRFVLASLVGFFSVVSAQAQVSLSNVQIEQEIRANYKGTETFGAGTRSLRKEGYEVAGKKRYRFIYRYENENIEEYVGRSNGYTEAELSKLQVSVAEFGARMEKNSKRVAVATSVATLWAEMRLAGKFFWANELQKAVHELGSKAEYEQALAKAKTTLTKFKISRAASRTAIFLTILTFIAAANDYLPEKINANLGIAFNLAQADCSQKNAITLRVLQSDAEVIHLKQMLAGALWTLDHRTK